MGCPSYQDAAALWSKINWTKLEKAGWKTTSMPIYGTQSKSFVQFYEYDNEGDGGCWAYLTVF